MKSQLFQHSARRNKILELIDQNSVVILHSGYSHFMTNDECFPFVVNNNFYYLSGIDQEDSLLVMGKNGNSQFTKLFIAKPTEYHEKWLGHQLTIEEASSTANINIEDIKYMEDFDNYLSNLLQTSRYAMTKIQMVYLDLEKVDLPLYQTYALSLAHKLQKEHPSVVIKDIYDEIIKLRMIKDEEEVELIKQSIETTNNAIKEVMKHHHGLDNESLAEAYYNFINTKEQKPLSFPSIVAAGVNATILHYTSNNSPIKQNDLLLMDVGCATKHYASDITRTFPVSGKFSDLQKKVYEIVLNCNKACIAYAKDGITWLDLNNYATNILAKGLKELGLIEDDKDVNKYYFHSIGHSLGLDVHDPCIRNMGLKEGMVITIEPGLYIKEWNIGIRIEDNILITKEKAIVLSSNIMKEIAEIESFLAK